MSLSEEIMLKVAKLREEKRLEYESSHRVIIEELTKKTKLFNETTSLFEKAVQDYQRLYDSRFEVAGISTRSVLTVSAEASTSHASYSTIAGSTSPEPKNIYLNCEDDRSQKFQPPSLTSESHSSESSVPSNKTNFAENIGKARRLCQAFKKRCMSLEASIFQARLRVEAARKEYYLSLHQLDKLEKDLLSISSTFESQKRVDIEKHFKELSHMDRSTSPVRNQTQLPNAVYPSVTPKLAKSTTLPLTDRGLKRKFSHIESETSEDGRPAMICPPIKRSVAIQPPKPSSRNLLALTTRLAPILCMLAPMFFQTFQKLS